MLNFRIIIIFFLFLCGSVVHSQNFVHLTGDPLVNNRFVSSGACWGDFNGDGYPDLFVPCAKWYPNALYLNDTNGGFIEILEGPVVSDSADSKSATWGDYDNDGDLDLFVANYDYIDDVNRFNDGEENVLYTNSGNSNSWINIQCVGTISNRSAIGTKVRVKARIFNSPVWQMREISGQTGGGFCAQNSLNAEFGFGDAAIIDSLIIEWPRGNIWETTDVAVNQHLIITEQVSSDVNNEISTIFPGDFLLEQNYPNPFNPSTTIHYNIPFDSGVNVKLDVYNVLGQLLITLVDGTKKAGSFSVVWNGKDKHGLQVPPGVYIYRLTTDALSFTKKMVLTK